MNLFKTNEKNVLGRIIEERAQENNDKVFLYFEDQKITYKEMNETVNRIANGFIEMGVEKGDKVGLMMENCPEFIYTWFALSKIGAIETPINVYHKGGLLRYLVNYSDAEILMIGEDLVLRIKAIACHLRKVKRLIVHPFTSEQTVEQFSLEPYQNLLSNPTSSPETDVEYKDLVAILFTSGTTGPSKGVMITHNQAIFIAKEYIRISNAHADDRIHLYFPLFHVAAQFAGVLTSLLANAAIVLQKTFSATAFWNETKKYGATLTGGFESVLRILYKMPRRDDDKKNSVRSFLCGHIPSDIHRDFERRFNVKLIDVYGMTEVDCPVTATYDDVRIGSCGKANSNFDVRLFDDDDNEVPIGEVGEIVLRPLQPHILMEGYYKMPEKTLVAFRNLWFHTGDMAYRDAEGYYYFVDRKKDMIRRRGENISSIEVERMINSHPSVRECVVVGVPDEISGEEIKAVLTLKEGKELKPEELIAYCDERMAYFMVPRYVEISEILPKELDGQKVAKHLLKKVTHKTWDRAKAGVKLGRELKKRVVRKN